MAVSQYQPSSTRLIYAAFLKCSKIQALICHINETLLGWTLASQLMNSYDLLSDFFLGGGQFLLGKQIFRSRTH